MGLYDVRHGLREKISTCDLISRRSRGTGRRQGTPWTLSVTEPQKMVVFGIQLKSFQSHALQSSSRFSARREASESAKQIKFG